MSTSRQSADRWLVKTDDVDASTARTLNLVREDVIDVDPLAEEHGEEAPKLAAVAARLSREANYRRCLAVADGAAALIAVLAGALVAHRTPTWGVLFVPAFAVLVAKVEHLYDRDDQVISKSNIGEWRYVLRFAAITAMGVYLAWRVLTNAGAGPGMRAFLFLTVACFGVALFLRYVARLIACATSPLERVVIVGDPKQCQGLALRLAAARGVQLVGMIFEESLSGSVKELSEVVQELDFHRMVIAPSGEPNDNTLHLIQAAKYIGIRVTLVPHLMTAVGGFALIEDLDGMTLLGVPSFGLSRSSILLKRAFDLLVGGAALLLLTPLMLIIGLLIRLDSPGPALFRQTRIGRNGKPFRILKFRSMVNGADAMKAGLVGQNEASDGLFKIADDPRITRVGRFIRTTHADELPQLLNVMRGEMSLVGPRPLIADEDARVLGRDRHRVRLTPGMTGPWQIKGPLDTPLSEMATLDYRYASSWSIWHDIDILLQTVVRVLGRSGH